ncbi:MAG TPA: division plane positioning ATPase MipZ [Croceibacterium sp.]|nr:division plane positioning ATPase MipZ [Croceibacterium sp.]
MNNCHVFAKRGHIERLEGAVQLTAAASLTLHAVAGHETLPPEVLRHAQCIVLEVDPLDELSLARMEQVRRTRPAMPIIAAIENADFNLTRILVRQGVFDVVALPFDVQEVVSRVMDASAVLAASDRPRLAPMVTLAKAINGIGSTTVVTHLAAALADGGRRRVCVVDLDLQYGQVANYFGIAPALSVVDLLEAGERLDGHLVRNVAADTGRGPFVIGAPTVIAPLEAVDLDRLLHMLDTVRQEFDFVLVDLPANWTNWTLSAALASSQIVLLTDQSVNGVRQAKRCLELFDSIEMATGSVGIVVNRYEKKLLQKIGLGDITRVLQKDVLATLALDKSGLPAAQDQGLLLDQVSRKARFSSDIAGLAGQLESLGEEQ